MRGRAASRAIARAWRTLGCVALVALSGCAHVRERLGLGRPAAAMPGEPPTASAFLGIDRVLRAPGEPDGRFERVSYPDSLSRGRVLPGDSALVLDLPGPGVVRRIRIGLSSADPSYLRRIVLRMYWDEEVEPSVEAPLGDFFADAFERRPYASLPMGASSGGFYSYLAMPFARHARIAIANESDQPIEGLAFDADVETDAQLPPLVATLHARWSRDARPSVARPHVVVDLNGTGWYVGTSLAAQGYDSSLDFLRGQERMRVDGRGVSPTTAAVYLDAADSAVAGAFQGVVLRDAARGRIAAYRWHLPDPIPFRSSFRLELERGIANREGADYATVAYWYQVEPHTAFPPLPSPAERRVPDVIFPASARYRDDLEMFGTGQGTLTLNVPVPRPDRYELMVFPEASPGAANPSVRVREQGHTARTIEVNAPGAEPGDVLPGVVLDTVAASTRTVALEVSSTGGIALPAAVSMRALPHWVREWWVLGPWASAPPNALDAAPALDSVWGPELDPDRLQSFRIPDVGPTAWESADADTLGTLSLERFRGNAPTAPQLTAYAQSFVYSPQARNAALLVDTDGPYRLWVNGQPVGERRGRNLSTSKEQEVAVSLRSGWNRVMVKVPADEGWSVGLRAADPRSDLVWSRTAPGF